MVVMVRMEGRGGVNREAKVLLDQEALIMLRPK